MSAEIKTDAPVWPKQVDEGYTITYKFSTGGVDFFAVTDAFNIGSQRALSAMHVYDEWQSRMTNDTLRIFLDAMIEELDATDGVIKISKITQYIHFMKERMNWPIPTSDLFYKMASVLVFDANESPYYYDSKYNDEVKIPHWKKHGVDTFFLSNALKTLLPLPTIAPDALSALQKIVDQSAKNQRASLPDHLQTDFEPRLNRQEQPESVS